MNSVQVGSKFVSEASPTYMIAEIGINHNGDLEIAKKLIDEAVKSGFDAVKFQKRTVKIVFTEEELNRHRESVFGTTNGDLKYGLEFDHNDFAEIDQYCKKSGIDWFASPWDNESLEFLEKFNVVAHKVASACLTDKELLRGLKATKRPVFLSTGMSSLDQIKTAVELLDPENTILMHAISVYPAKQEQLHLSWITDLKNNFPGIPVGYSGHEAGVMPSVIAVAKFGAVCVERHITLDRTMYGSDQAASIETNALQNFVQTVRAIPAILGNGKKILSEAESKTRDKLRINVSE